MKSCRSFFLALTPIALGVALACPGLSLAQPQVTAPVPIQISAQPLAAALNEVARQSGLQVIVAPSLVDGRMAPALSGRFTGPQALVALLKDSGLVMRQTDASTYVIQGRPAPAGQLDAGGEKARPGSGAAVQALELPEVLVIGQRPSQGTTTLNRRTLSAIPGGNGDVTSLLKVVPNVQFANEQSSTATLGEIAPPDISINGAKYYDNLFQMDGMSFNSDINPGGAGSELNSPASPGQGFAIDTSLLCSVTVRDSNVGAEFGRFTGGVVSVDTCAPTKAFAGDVSLEHTRSSWTQYMYAPGQESAFAQSASASQQPEFEKWTYRVGLQSKVSEELGLIGSVVRKTSDVPLRGYTNGLSSNTDDNEKVRRHVSDNLFLKAFWTPVAGVMVDASIMHAPSSTRGFIQNAKDSYYVNESGGTGLNVGVSHPLGSLLNFNHRMTATQTEGSRDADASTWKLWRYSAQKNWGNPAGNSGEGGYGDVEQVEKKLGYQFKADLSPQHWLGVQHHLQGGLDYERMTFDYRRLTDYYQYTSSTNTTTCTQAGGVVDTQTCSLATPYNASSGGQYLRSRIVYRAGAYDLQSENLALHLQDEFRKDRLRLRLGVRYENDQLASSEAWAPRLAGFYDLFGDGRTNIEIGSNRYFGRNFNVYRSYKARLALQSGAQTRTVSGGVLGAWAAPVFGSTAAMYNVGDLKLPYTDERVLGISHALWNATWGIKYVERKSRDEVVLHLRSVGNYWWDNVGKTDTDVLTLSATTQQPIRLAGSLTTVMAALDYTNSKTSHADYSDTLNSNTGELEQLISYNGQVIRYIDRPANNYNRPWTARLLVSTRVPAWRLTLDHLLRLRDGYVKVDETDDEVEHQGTMIPVWRSVKHPKSVTWDVRARLELSTLAEQSAYVELTVENLLNRRNLITQTKDDDVSSGQYEKGRQFWLRLGYKF